MDSIAVGGISVGVALLFAAQVAGTSLTQSVQRLSSQLVGSTQYQFDARGSVGVSERVLTEVRHIPGVRVASPVLERQAQVIGPNGQMRSVDLIGTNPQFARFGGPLMRRFSASLLAAQRAIALPNPIAEAIGAGALQTIRLQVGARTIPTLVGATLGAGDIGSLVDSPVALAPVKYAQQVTGMVGRVTRIFVQSQPGRNTEVLRGLRRLAVTVHASIEPANFDAKLFSIAALPENQGEMLFSLISALVGFLFAINAMLITVPRRRRLIDHVRLQGANRGMALQLALLDAAVLGILACVFGLAFGEILSRTVLRSTPGYLSFAFPVGSGRVVTWQCVVIAVVAGIGAACAGVLIPLRDVFVSPKWHQVLARQHWIAARVALGIAGLATTTAILIAHPAASNLGNFTLVVALLCLLPFEFNAVVAVFAHLQRALSHSSPRVTLILRVSKTRVRSLAIVAIAAVAVFGVVSIQGAQRNLQRGLDASASGIDSGADIWVTPRGESNAFATTPFSDPGARTILARLSGVATVSEYRGSFLTWGDRRLWVLGPPSSSAHPIPPSEVPASDLTLATARLRAGGWAVISRELAAEHDLRVGEAFVLPSPEPRTFRVAALSTNLGWPPGAVIVNASDYARAWGSREPSGYEIDTKPGVSLATVRREAQAALGPHTGLAVETFGEREQRHFALASQGLLRLTQIRFLVLIDAMLAIAGALGSLIWQRRGYVAFVRSVGFGKAALQRWLLWEGTILLSIGCLTGAIFGIYGQLLMSHALASVTGFPIAFGVEALVALSTFGLVSVGAVTVLSIAGFFIVRVRPQAARPTG